jgi:murein DD-endopeptidase MepM/ murein hydrolase activator NlpD
MYAHLSRVDGVLASGRAGSPPGSGATGHATGPHLHFELRIRNASVDLLRALPNAVST